MSEHQTREEAEMQRFPAIIAQCAAGWNEQRMLCDALEQIADTLPDSVDHQICIKAARALPTVVLRAHRLEEDAFFSALDSIKVRDFDPRPTLARLRIEHTGDACFAEEISEVLMSYGTGKPTHDAEAMGYMLRGFFEALRRHIAIEEELAAMLSQDQTKI